MPQTVVGHAYDQRIELGKWTSASCPRPEKKFSIMHRTVETVSTYSTVRVLGVLVANGKAKLVSIQIKFPTFSRIREKIKKFPVDIRSSTDNYSYLAVCGCSFSVREYNSWCWIICCCLEKMQPNRTARQRTKETRCDFFPILTTTRKTCSSLAFSR